MMDESSKAGSLECFLGQGDVPQLREDEKAKTFKRRSNINLQKSIQLLNDAVSPSLNRTSRTQRGSLRHLSDLSYTQDISDAFKFTPGKRRSMKPDDTLISSPMTFGDLTNFEPTVAQDITVGDLTFINAQDPGEKVSEGLFETFSESLKRNASPHQVMSLLEEYIDMCNSRTIQLNKVTGKVTRNQSKCRKSQAMGEMLRDEKQTWMLFHCLYKDRLEMEERANALMEEDETQPDAKTSVWALSEQNIVNRLFEKDTSVRQSQLVVDWLETCASDTVDQPEKAKLYIEQPVAWENTLHNLQKREKGVKSAISRHVTEMDPDAPCRQNLPLDDLDREDEQHFLKSLFVLIRAGQLDKAQQLCQSCGQPWRAATLEGWRLFHDSNYYSKSSVDDVVAIEGNPSRDIWKSVCWAMAKEPSLNMYEKATYAALSGNLHAVLPVCDSWMDYVWAYFKVMVDIKVEREVRLHRTVSRTLDSLPSEYGSALLEPHEIFKEIAASIDEDLRLDSENWFHIIQKYVILGDTAGLIEIMYSWVQTNSAGLPSHILRVLAHIVLFLRSIGYSCKEELCEAILEAFVEDLIRNKRRDVVSHYVSALVPEAQVQWYATFLEDIDEQAERQQCLSRAEEEGLDVAAITKTVVERIRMRDSGPSFPENSLAADIAITEEGKEKINAIDWLVFDENHRPEALRQANAIMRSFIVVKKHLAARQVFEKLPTDTVEVIFRLWHQKTGSTELSPGDNNAIREYLCMKAYLDAVESFNDWFNLFHKGQPVQPVGIDSGASFTDRVAFEHKMKQFNMEKERWKHNLLVQTKSTRDRIYNVLLFADGGWLKDACHDPLGEESRQHQMAQLRKLHLPGLCLNLHTVLHSCGLYPEAVQIADVVASELHQLYKDFDKKSLQHLLDQISKSSTCLLDENRDPLGYEMV